jgi:hypothetical protein
VADGGREQRSRKKGFDEARPGALLSMVARMSFGACQYGRDHGKRDATAARRRVLQFRDTLWEGRTLKRRSSRRRRTAQKGG